MLVKPSTPSGFRIGPRTPISAPEENAEVITPARTRTPVNHATHLQRLLGSLPVGNSKTLSENFPIDLEQRRISPRMDLPIVTVLKGDAPYERGYHNQEGGLL